MNKNHTLLIGLVVGVVGYHLYTTKVKASA